MNYNQKTVYKIYNKKPIADASLELKHKIRPIASDHVILCESMEEAQKIFTFYEMTDKVYGIEVMKMLVPFKDVEDESPEQNT